MKTIIKTSNYLIITFFVTMAISIVPALSWTDFSCEQEVCSAVLDKKGTELTIGILPDDNSDWPVLITEPTNGYTCGANENYPCLVWPYKYVSGAANLITQIYVLIPFCCDNPIKILASSKNISGGDLPLSCEESSAFPNVCSGYTLRLENNSGIIEPNDLLFWFATQPGIDTGMIDISFNSDNRVCKTGIKGPKCSLPTPPVYVEPVTQCYQFKAEVTEGCPEAKTSTWVIRWENPNDKCNVNVWAAYGDEWNCDNVVKDDNYLEGVPIQSELKTNDGKSVSSLFSVDECDTSWIRSVDPYGCNGRCYVINGTMRCF